MTEQQQGHLPPDSAEIEPSAVAAADLQHPLRGIQSGERGTLLQGNWWNRSLDSQIFSGTDFMIPFLHLFISKRSLNPFVVTSAPCDYQENFCRVSAWLHWPPPSPKSYLLTFPTTSLEKSLRAIWGAVSQAAVFILSQIKLKSHVVHLFSCYSHIHIQISSSGSNIIMLIICRGPVFLIIPLYKISYPSR